MFDLLKGDIIELFTFTSNVVGFKIQHSIAVFYNYYYNYYCYYCVNNKRLEYDWLLTAFISGLIGCFRFKLSELTCPITNIYNRTGQIGQLSSQ